MLCKKGLVNKCSVIIYLNIPICSIGGSPGIMSCQNQECWTWNDLDQMPEIKQGDYVLNKVYILTNT